MFFYYPLVTILFTFVAFLVLYPLAKHFNWLDKPCSRKQHDGAVPLIGGIGIFIGVMSTIFFMANINTLELRLFVTAGALMVFIGVLDDKYDLSVRLRIISQILAASVIIFGGGVYITDLGPLLADWPAVNLGTMGIPFTYLAVLAAMNAYNMVDGIDGLLGALGAVTFASIALLTCINGQALPCLVSSVMLAALIPFLISNLQLFGCRKIFMGDAGSMFIGLSIVWLLTMSTQSNVAGDNVFRPVVALWFVAVPILDMLAIIVRRLYKGRSPFKPDRDHQHHLYMRVGLSPTATLAIIVLKAVAFAAVGILGELFAVPTTTLVLLFLAATTVYFFNTWFWHKRKHYYNAE